MNGIVIATAATLVVGGIAAVPSAAAATTHACGNHALAVTATPTEGATGHSNLVLLFRNKSTKACTLYGYPSLDALNASGQVIKHAKRTVSGARGGSTHGIRTITVRPRHYASAIVEWHNFNFSTGQPCRSSHAVAATPASTSDTVHLARRVNVCGLEVHPTVAGKTGDS